MELIDIRTYTSDRIGRQNMRNAVYQCANRDIDTRHFVKSDTSLNKFLAQPALQYAGIEDRHLAAHYGKCQVVSVASTTITRQ